MNLHFSSILYLSIIYKKMKTQPSKIREIMRTFHFFSITYSHKQAALEKC